MFISGLSCSYCGGKLEVLRMVEGVLHTRCTCCQTVSEPKEKPVSTAPLPARRFHNKSSGTFAKVEVRYKPKKEPLLWKPHKKNVG